MDSVTEGTAADIKRLGDEKASDFGPDHHPPEVKKLFSYIESQRTHYITQLREAVAIRSISAWPHARSESIRMIQWTATKLHDLGFAVDIRKVGEETLNDGNVIPYPPIILAKLGENPNHKTLLIYGHVDVNPAHYEEGWDSDPFVLVDFHGALYGRGSADNKGPLLGWLHAIEAYRKNHLELPINIKFVIEGMEERGSQGLRKLLEADPFVADVDSVVISDGSWLGKHKPCLIYGLRGLLYFFVEVESGTMDLHSGVFGGCLKEALPDLIYLMNTLVDANGHILIPGINDEVCPISTEEEEVYHTIEFDPEEFRHDAGIHSLSDKDKVGILMKRWRLPALTIHGIQGCFSTPGAMTVIPRKVIGKFSLRLVPNQKVETVEKLVIDYVHAKWAERGSHNNMLVYTACDGIPSWTSNPLHENYIAARRATAMVYGTFPDLIRDGGHMENVWALQDTTKQNILLLPMGAADDKAHSKNEKLDSRNYIEGTKVMAAYLHEFGKVATFGHHEHPHAVSHEHGHTLGSHEHGHEVGHHEHGHDIGHHEHGHEIGPHEHPHTPGLHEHGHEMGHPHVVDLHEHGHDVGHHEHPQDTAHHEHPHQHETGHHENGHEHASELQHHDAGHHEHPHSAASKLHQHETAHHEHQEHPHEPGHHEHQEHPHEPGHHEHQEHPHELGHHEHPHEPGHHEHPHDPGHHEHGPEHPHAVASELQHHDAGHHEHGHEHQHATGSQLHLHDDGHHEHGHEHPTHSPTSQDHLHSGTTEHPHTRGSRDETHSPKHAKKH